MGHLSRFVPMCFDGLPQGATYGALRHNRGFSNLGADVSRLLRWRSLGVSRVRDVARAMLVGALGWAGATAWGAAAVAPADAAGAAGLVVKLREQGAPASVVRLAATQRTAEPDRLQAARLRAVAQRRQVPLLARRATAFGAHVVNPQRLMTRAEAEREAARWRADPDVEWVIVNERVTAAALPTPHTAPALASPLTDTFALQQWWMARPTSGLEGVANVRGAWDQLAGRALYPVVVAVLDSGRRDIPGLAGRWFAGYDFVSEAAYAKDGDGLDPDPRDEGDQLTSLEIARDPPLYPAEVCSAHGSTWHGPTIAGMLGAMPKALDSGNTLGVVGMLPQLGQGRAGGPLVLPVRVSGSCGASVMDVIEGLLWAAGVRYQGEPLVNPAPARVINLSFGGDGTCTGANSDRDAAWLYRQAIAAVRSKGALIVASAGNGDFVTGAGAASRPANCAGVLAVTGLSKRGLKAHYANQTTSGLAVASGERRPEDVAYADYLLLPGYSGEGGSARPSAVYAAGTSFAAPMAAGVAAMMLALDPSITVDELHAVLTDPGPTGGLRPHVATGSVPGFSTVCSAGQPQQNCYCDTTTCGSGVLDAEKAVLWAAGRVDAVGAREAPETAVTASWFVPPRLQTPPPRTGGSGGGSMTTGWSLAWAALLALAASTGRRSQRQAAKPRF